MSSTGKNLNYGRISLWFTRDYYFYWQNLQGCNLCMTVWLVPLFGLFCLLSRRSHRSSITSFFSFFMTELSEEMPTDGTELSCSFLFSAEWVLFLEVGSQGTNSMTGDIPSSKLGVSKPSFRLVGSSSVTLRAFGFSGLTFLFAYCFTADV